MKKARITFTSTHVVEEEFDDDMDIEGWAHDMRGMFGYEEWDYEIEPLDD